MTVWWEDEFWAILEDFDLVFLNETHHTYLPHRLGWRIEGTERNSENTHGGVLALIRNNGKFNCVLVDEPFDGFIWLKLAVDAGQTLWAGGVYIPGGSDLRFRSLQGDGRLHHFDALQTQLLHRGDDLWILGGDFNAITNSFQAEGDIELVIDEEAPKTDIPSRSSFDKRSVNAHGRRLLDCIAGVGIILNGLHCLSFDPSFTRFPTKEADCPGVLDYAICSLSLLQHLYAGAFRVIHAPADYSDHYPIGLDVALKPLEILETSTIFQKQTLEAMASTLSSEELDTLEASLEIGF